MVEAHQLAICYHNKHWTSYRYRPPASVAQQTRASLKKSVTLKLTLPQGTLHYRTLPCQLSHSVQPGFNYHENVLKHSYQVQTTLKNRTSNPKQAGRCSAYANTVFVSISSAKGAGRKGVAYLPPKMSSACAPMLSRSSPAATKHTRIMSNCALVVQILLHDWALLISDHGVSIGWSLLSRLRRKHKNSLNKLVS